MRMRKRFGRPGWNGVNVLDEITSKLKCLTSHGLDQLSKNRVRIKQSEAKPSLAID